MMIASARATHLSRRAFLRALVLGSNAMLLGACQEKAAVTSPTPSAPRALAPGPAEPAGGWERSWRELVEAARSEGRVVVSGPPTPTVRTELPAAFKHRFDVELEYLGGNTSDLMTRLEAERASGQFTVDAILGGSQTLYTRAYPARLLDPIPPVLIHPEATDPTRWTAGRLWFMDPEQQYILRLANQVGTGVTVNTQYLPPDALRSWYDLLQPRYRGLISAYDPTVAGQGWPVAAYLLRMLGEDYVRALYQDQQPGLTRDYRQLGDWIARGTYPISLAVGTKDIELLQKDGFPIVRLRDFPEAPSTTTAGFGLAALLSRAPHPNAARLFVNWIAMQEGSEVFHRAEGIVSARTDVDNSWAPADNIPQPGATYFDTYDWEYTVSEFTPERLAQIRRLTGKS
jgi:iron(III) transport system substrate-binding protein